MHPGEGNKAGRSAGRHVLLGEAGDTMFVKFGKKKLRDDLVALYKVLSRIMLLMIRFHLGSAVKKSYSWTQWSS